jgi:isoquinoline 1-oxidoreductase subunit beta
MSDPIKLDRRQFLAGSTLAATGFMLGLRLPAAAHATSAATFRPNAFVDIATTGQVTVYVGASEMGQGVHTCLAMLLIEELDAEWSSVRVVGAPTDPAFANPTFGMQATGGSNSVSGFWEPMRRAGAAARAMLVAAAAKRWEVAASECRTRDGTVVHAVSGRSLSYGELAQAAGRESVPESITLKSPESFRLLGRETRRVNARNHVDGSAIFGIDVQVPGMLTAVIARPPSFGDTVRRIDDSQARKIPGVKAIVQVDAGVAVVADKFWTAERARRALSIEWNAGPLRDFDSVIQQREYAGLVREPTSVARMRGDVESGMQTATSSEEAQYEFPYLATAPMEPLNCVAHVERDKARVWVGTQFPSMDREAAAKAAGLPVEKVELHTTLLGGGFGRRGVPDGHFVREAVQVSKAVGAPVKVIWTREEDIRGGYYRPASSHLVRAGLDAAGKPIAWLHRIVCQPILIGTTFEGDDDRRGFDGGGTGGSSVGHYAIANRRTEMHAVRRGPPVWAFRSVGSTHNAFVTETFIDQLAVRAGQDPLQYRLQLLSEPRFKAVLELAAEKSGWGRPMPQGRALGCALHQFDSFVAQVAEVSVAPDGSVRVHRVTCAVDCGFAVDPANVRAQMEGAIGMGLSAFLHGRITLTAGRVDQSNFHDYRLLRINEMPAIDVHILSGGPKPLGVGEAGLPPIAPAVANAMAKLTGQRIYKPAQSIG